MWKYFVVQLVSHVWLFVTPWTAARQASQSLPCPQSLLKLMSIESAIPSNHLISVIPFSSFLQSVPASGSFPMSRPFASGGQRIGASTFSISPSSEYSASISFGIYWFDLLAVQGTLKSFKYHSLKALILQHSVYFRVHLSHLYMTTGKIIPLTIQILVNEVMSLLFNMLSMFVIALFPRKKRLLKYVGMRIILF